VLRVEEEEEGVVLRVLSHVTVGLRSVPQIQRLVLLLLSPVAAAAAVVVVVVSLCSCSVT